MTNTFHTPKIEDPEIALAYEMAAKKNVLAALYDEVFFGHWNVCVDGVGHGWGNTFPSLDGHQMTDALLFLGETERVKANWDYVRRFQRADGHLPIGIFPDAAGKMIGEGDSKARVSENGAFYHHWVPGDPLLALGAITFIQNGDVIFEQTGDLPWLREQLPALNLAAHYLLSLQGGDGFIKGSGFYVERPTRFDRDGVTQCHAVDALRRLARLNRLAGHVGDADKFAEAGEALARRFCQTFWLGHQFGEYIHPGKGMISTHGFTDVDWAAIACDVATPEQTRRLWPQLKTEMAFYYGGMPCGIATMPTAYEAWEFSYPDKVDLAAMGRVWYLECWARSRMGDREGIIESLRRVIAKGKADDWFWRERYAPNGDPFGSEQYCEYPANLIRIVNRFLLPD